MIAFHSRGSTFAYRYSFVSSVWLPSRLQPKHDLQGVGAVTDPNTGLVYLAAGYAGDNRNSMDIYDFETDTMVSNPMSAQALAIFSNRAYYANVWSEKRKSILYFGGYNATLSQISDNNITEFVPATQTWSTL
ncbi:hypothetical protein BGZ65_001226, partial [Modicella reniformis]